MTTTLVPSTSPVGNPPVVHGGHPRDALISENFGIETAEDVVKKRGLSEDATAIADILTNQPKYATHKPTPEEALNREKKRLAYEELKNLWETVGQEEDAKLLLLKKKVADIEAAMTYWREQNKPEKGSALQPQLDDAQKAVSEYQSSRISEAQRAQLIAYGKKRLAQLATIADYLEHWGRKERMGGVITKLERQKELLWRQINAKVQEKERVEEELGKENEKGGEKNQIIIDWLEEEKALLENHIAQLNGEASLVRDEEEMIERSVNADGIRGATQSQNITLANVVAQRGEVVSKLRALGVPEQEINELVVVWQQQEDTMPGVQLKNVQLLGTETGEPVTEMNQLVPGRAWNYTHIQKIISLSAPSTYIIELDTGEKYKKRQLLVSAKPWHAVELLSGGDGASASEVSIRTVGETKVIVCEETQWTDAAGSRSSHTNTYRIYNERTWEQLGQEIRIDGYIRFEREFLEGFDYITEIEYGVGVDMKKWLINIATGAVIIDQEQWGINRRYNLLASNGQSSERRLLREKFKKHEEVIGSVDGLIASLQQKYYVLVQTDGCLCLVDKNTNKRVGYVTPKSSRWYTEQQGYMTMVYEKPTWDNISDGSIDMSSIWTYMTLPGEKVFQEQVSRWPILRNFAETLRIEKEYAFLQRNVDKARVLLNYTTWQMQELWKGDIKLDFPNDFVCIGDGDIDKLYYVRQEANGSHTIDGVCQTNDLHRLRLLWTNKESDVLVVWIPNPTSKSRQYYLYNKKTWWRWTLYKSSKEEDIGARKTLRLYTGDGPFATIGGPDVTIVSDNYRDIVEVTYK